jgi:hypothetical protein
MMEQTSSSELEVFFLPSPSTSAQDQSERSINPLEGWEAGWAAVEKDLEGLKMRAGSDERKGEPNREYETLQELHKLRERNYWIDILLCFVLFYRRCFWSVLNNLDTTVI